MKLLMGIINPDGGVIDRRTPSLSKIRKGAGTA
jgi:hypothetical protein